MKHTDLDTFQGSIREKGGYESPPERLAVVRRKPSGWITFRFCLSLSRVFPFCALWDLFRKLTKRSWVTFCMSSVTEPERYGMRVTVEGFGPRLEHKGPVMYLCNHMSTYETVVLMPILHAMGDFRFVAKEALAHLPLLAHAARIMGMVGLGRKNPRADLMKLYEVGCREIAGGASFLIFPQGTRQDVFTRSHFSSIGAKLAERAKIPIVPIAVDSRCLPTRKSGLLAKVFKDFGTVDTSRDIRIAAGPLIECTNAREMHQASFDWIADRLESWGLPVDRTQRAASARAAE